MIGNQEMYGGKAIVASLSDASTRTFIVDQGEGKFRFIALSEDGVSQDGLMKCVDGLTLSMAIREMVLFYAEEWEVVVLPNKVLTLSRKMRESISE